MRLKLKTLVGSLVLVLPTAGYTAPVVPASQPLFLTEAVKHNIMLGIDDSSSMDSEVLFPSNDGALWLNADGSFSNLDGTFVKGPDLPKYTYLFPNGASSDYVNGAAIVANDGHYAIPPIRSYAFARSSSYNRAYYDPNETYRPWPSFGSISYPEYPGTQAPFDPNEYDETNADTYLNLVASVDTSQEDTQWDFDIRDEDMVCDSAGNSNCSVGDKDYTYWPATYWVLDETSEFSFSPSLVNGESFHEDNSRLFEAENATFKSSGNDYSKASTNSSVARGVLVNSASAEDYIATNEGAANDDPSLSLSYGQASFSFTVPSSGDYHIWIRKFSKDGNSDSLWVNLQGYGPSDDVAVNPLTIYDGNSFVESSGEYWVKWWQGLTQTNDWSWDRVATGNLSVSTTYTLRIRPRESYVPVDQVMITKVADKSPSGALALLPAPQPVTLSCSGSAPGYYDIFRRSPGAFDFPGDSESDFALTPDGKCLKKVEIRSTVTSYPSGRTYAEELQNFSNWFTYYRRRHQAMRGGLASAFQGIGGIQTGVFWINNQRTVDMYDLDTVSDQQAFLGDIYNHVGSGGTALRSTLNHARTQFQRTGESAPIQYECQKNFTLLFTDGYATDTDFTGVANADGSAGAPYQDAYSNTLADIAFSMYTENPRTDITPTGAVAVPAICADETQTPPASVDCNADLHINTYTVGLGAKGTIFGQDYNVDGESKTYDKVSDAYSAAPSWPDVGLPADAVQIDDLYHAAVNGRGDIYNANTPAQLQSELSATIRDIVSSLGSASGVTFNSATLESDSLIFSALFNSTSWSGDVEARALNPSTGAISSSRSWSAAEQLSGQQPSQRTILTYSNTAADGVPFQWASLDTGQQADLGTDPNGDSDSFGEERLAYLRGDTSYDGQQLRNRDGLLGDIVNSTPLFVGAPRMNWPDAAPFGTEAFRYSAFRGNATNVERTPMVYVGSNDGMLHGFKAVESSSNGGGDELLAYVPRSIFSTSQNEGLHYLTDPAYRHRYYVDLSPQAVDVYMPGTSGGTPAWRTVLIGGLRGGGAGLFALDVTNPSNFSEANASDLVLWEFDDTDLPQMNYQLEQPVVVMMNNNRWALVLGNGFNNGDGSNAADDETGLLILYMDGGLDGEWTSGANGTPNDYEFLKVGDTGGLGAVNAIDTNGDRVVDRIYGGDLQGNLWVFDVTGSNPGNWGSAYTGSGNQGSAALPLFQTLSADTDSDGIDDRFQPISQRPLVLRNTLSPEGTEGGSGEDYLVYFGTGKYFENGDLTDTSDQSMYAVWDRGDSQLTRDDLQEQLIAETGGSLRNITGGTIDWAGEVAREYGWFMDLPESGERVLNPPKFRGEILFFETYTPNSAACASGGTSWFMSVTMDGVDPPFAVFDANNDGVISSDEGIYAGQKISNSSTGATGILGNSQYYQNLNGQPDQREVDYGEDTNRAGRLGWRELIDF
ncbi:hypothetical protein MD273_16280 [Marinobacter pelagius]|uniref:pilus assembly protein n=1 Tax=Marinobacter sp. C7 TaxID=2951363 RepID=UPI001EF15D14|nr:PilC/PilY family type IV pilus protein [Marinobacter sp. C7]MCG7201294.1 hypothetical protein [Marinobacter sp. C7]